MPPSNPPEVGLGPLAPRTGGGIPPTPLLRAGWPRQDEPARDRAGRAAFLPAARAEIPFLQLGGNTRMRAENPHCPSVSERPLARNKVLCQAFFERKRGGEMYVHYWE